MRELTVHQHYELPTESGTYLLLCTKMRPESPDFFLSAEGFILRVDQESGKLYLWLKDMRGRGYTFPLATEHTVDQLIEADDVECVVSPNDPSFWLDPTCTAPNQLRVSIPVDLEDELRTFLSDDA